MFISPIILVLSFSVPLSETASPPDGAKEVRAAWNHSGTGAYPGDWERSCRVLEASGFTMVLLNMVWGGIAHYPSKILPHSKTFRKYGDQIAQCLAAAKRHDIEVHVWKVNYNLATAPKEFVKKMRQAGRTQMSAAGKPTDWLCPSHPENQRLEREVMLEVVRKYQVAGIHFDYIRYPDREHCYCPGCRKRFEADSGKKVVRWPQDCYAGSRREEYNEWRCRQITRLVAAVSREARKIRPGIKISAAVYGGYPQCRASVAQDWPVWIKAGYLDFVCPMDYTANDRSFRKLVENQLRLVGERIAVYPGIGASATRPPLTADRVTEQIHILQQLGAGGFTLFELNRTTAETLLPGLGRSAGKNQDRSPSG